MIVFAVSQLRSYYDCGERYFGTEGIFLTYKEAKEFIKQEIDDIISGFNRDDHETFFGSNDEFDDEVSWDDDSISSGGHKFQWDISPVTLKKHVKQKVLEPSSTKTILKISKILSRSKTICSTTISAIFRLTP